MKIGAENKKSVYALTILGVVAAYMVYTNLLSGPSYPAATPAPSADRTISVPTPDKTSGPDSSRAAQDVPGRQTIHAKNGEFRPVLRSKKKEERPDPSKIDPTLRLDLLDKVMKVASAGGERDLFQISKTPPVKLAEALDPRKEPKVPTFVGPHPPPPPPGPAPPVPPPPPTPIPLKFFGYSAIHPDGKRTAYFSDGDEILQADEGTVLKGRYRVVQIGLDKVLVEDTQEKRRQPLPIEPEVTG